MKKKLFLIEVIPWRTGWALPHHSGDNIPEREDSLIFLIKTTSREKIKKWLKKEEGWEHGEGCYVHIKETKIIEI
jgi:hypothetical protein